MKTAAEYSADFRARNPNYHRDWRRNARCDLAFRKRDRATQAKHYEAHPERRIWNDMLRRCDNPTGRSACYSDVRVCTRWRGSFAAFLADIGPRPSPRHSIDRWPNPAGNYEPKNCRWATTGQQGRNKRTNVIIEFRGRRQCQNDWAHEIGVAPSTLCQRLGKGWSVREALTTPPLTSRYERNAA